jgi:hypothetical protein
MPLLLRGLQLGTHSFVKLFMITTFSGLLALLPTLYMAMRIGDTVLTPSAQLQFVDGRWGLIELLSLISILLLQGIVITRMDLIARENRTDLGVEWRSALRALLPLIGALLLCMGIFIVTCLVAGIAGMLAGLVGMLFAGKAGLIFVLIVTLLAACIYVSIYLLFIQYFIVLDRKNPLDAVNGSFNLVYGKWWSTFLVLLVLVLTVVILAVLIMLPFLAVFGAFATEQTGRGLLIKGVLEMIFTAIFAPFGLAVIYLLFQDLKLRRQAPA